MSALKALLESRDAAQAAYDAFVAPLIESGEDLTPEQETERGTLRSAIEKFDARIDEEHAKEKRAKELAEVRDSLTAATVPAAQVTEPTVYGNGSPNSYYLDLCYATLPLDPRNGEARERLTRASHEAAVEMVSNPSAEKRARIRDMVWEEKRGGGRESQNEAVKRYEALGRTGRGELRTGMDTTAGSGGSFATPVYFVGEYAPWREYGRAFADECNKQTLPTYGMTVYIPHVTGGAAVASQSTQNTGIQETDPTAGYLSANLTTEAGQVTVSQQLLDRAGPGFPFDRMVFDQLNRDYAPKVDTLVLTAALAGAGTIAYTAGSFALTTASGTAGFYSKVASAKNTIRRTAGTVMNPTHLFVDPARWEYITSFADVNGRPLVVPSVQGPWNAVATHSDGGDEGIEGKTGYTLNGLPVFQDANIPTPSTGADQAIVGNLGEVYLFEANPVTRAVPQTLANNLSVLLQLYSYIAVIVRYPSAVQTITGTGMGTISFGG